MIRALLVLAMSCGPRPPVAPERPHPSEPPLPARWPGPALDAKVSIVAVGDLLMHTNVKHSARRAAAEGVAHGGFPDLFEPVREHIASADLAFANLETPVAPDHDKGTRSMVFNVDAALLPALSEVGFDVLSFANNHVYDQGRDGFVETMDRLDDSGMTWIGSGRTCEDARRPRFTDTNGIKIAWIGTSKVYNSRLNTTDDKPCSFYFDTEQVLASAAAAREQGADMVFASVHWGREYHTEPDPAEIADAYAMIDGGIDVVIGHHAHVVQPLELRDAPDGRLGLIAFGLGNAVSNQRYNYRFGAHPAHQGDPRDGLMLAFDVVRKRYGPGDDGQPVQLTTIANVRGIPVWTDNNAGRIVHPSPTIRMTVTGDAIEEAYAALDASEPKDRLLHEQRIEMLRYRWWRVSQIVGERFMPPEPR